MARHWWQDAVIYQIYPRSFLDRSGDGIGDLEGVTEQLDYLTWLGVDGIWLSPIFPSPMADFGYDVSDYCDIDPVFGDLEAFDHLMAGAHRRGLKVLLDWVPNHTSSQHHWFRAARRSTQDPHRDFYIWRPSAEDGGPPNNWVRSWSDQPAWTFDEASEEWYLHCFLPEQPDLNWASPAVRSAMADTLRFWLDRGVDGFRMDVIHLIGKDPSLGDDPADLAALSHVPLNDRPETHEYLRELRSVLDSYEGDRMAVGEVYLLDPAQVLEYGGQGDELHLCFNFEPLMTPWRAERWREVLLRNDDDGGHMGRWPTMVLNNHDNPRLRTRVGGSDGRARVAAAILLLARGTPFLYAGEELGLEDGELASTERIDPGGRDGCRRPIPWTPMSPHGWSSATPWLPFPPHAKERAVSVQRDDPSSMLSWYRTLLMLRRSEPALVEGRFELLESPDEVVAFARDDGRTRLEIWCNFSHRQIDCSLEGVVLASSVGDSGGGVLAGDAAIVIKKP